MYATFQLHYSSKKFISLLLLTALVGLQQWTSSIMEFTQKASQLSLPCWGKDHMMSHDLFIYICYTEVADITMLDEFREGVCYLI